jgi:hypothetical protein
MLPCLIKRRPFSLANGLVAQPPPSLETALPSSDDKRPDSAQDSQPSFGRPAIFLPEDPSLSVPPSREFGFIGEADLYWLLLIFITRWGTVKASSKFPQTTVQNVD